MIFISRKRLRITVSMNNYYDAIKNRIDIRKNLIALRSEVQKEDGKKALAYSLAGDFSVFEELLSHEDAKVRKNAALLLADMECEEMSECIWEAYKKEQTLFVRGDYLKALNRFDCRAYLQEMKDRMRTMEESTPLPEEEKHFRSEYTQLKYIVMRYDRPTKHKFNGYEKCHEIILMTNRNQREATRRQLEEEHVKMLAGGMRFSTTRLKEILTIRTYSEMLFPIKGAPFLDGSPERMAGQLMESDMMKFLLENHWGDPPFYFRLETRSTLLIDQKVDLVKKVSSALERLSKGQLLNTTSGYEIELRLVAGKDGRFIPLLKMFTVPDWRFAYRKECLPTSIAPVNAALIMELSKEYLKEDAQVLDPFCGVGTMLVERGRLTPVRSMYGIDILSEAIEKARENASIAHLVINYINRDFFDFRHDYLFDEIVTNMPGVGKTRDICSLTTLYNRFLDKIPEVMEKGGVIIAYTMAHELLRQCLRNRTAFIPEKEYCINEREKSYLHIFRYRG